MRNIAYIIFFALMACAAKAQPAYTEHLKKQGQGEGKIVIVQDSEIDDIVNNVKKDKPATPKKDTAPKKDSAPKKDNAPQKEEPGKRETADNTNTPTHFSGTRQRVRASGYRIQIFTGGNSHTDKSKAFDYAEKCRKAFPELSVYPRFTSPRWICRIGDFRTHEDAQKYATKIRAKKLSNEVRIVKCEVLLPR